MSNTQPNAAKVNPVIYSEKFGNDLTGSGELVVKQLDKAGTLFALVGYLPAGICVGPHVFTNGTIDDCRKTYKMARSVMQKWLPAK